MWVVQVPFYASQCIKDAQYLPEDENGMKILRLRPMEESVELETAAVGSTKNCRKRKVLQVVTLRKIQSWRRGFCWLR